MGKTATVKEVLVSAGKGIGKGRKSGGSKKHGRNKVKCTRYRAEGRLEKNKAKKARKQKKVEAKHKAKRGGGNG